MVGCVVTEYEWPAIARARTVAVVQTAPSQGASTSPFTSQRYRLDAQTFQGHRPVDWHGMAWWESSSHAADGRLPTPPKSAALQRDTSFVQSLTVLSLSSYCMWQCCSPRRRPLINLSLQTTHTAPEPPTSLRFSAPRIEGLFAT
jgi:hypothetical protein